jgi:hypothetical protein
MAKGCPREREREERTGARDFFFVEGEPLAGLLAFANRL